MKVLATFYGNNRTFRAWLAAGMPANVVCMEVYRKKKTVSKKTATGKKSSQISTSSIPDGVA